MKKIVSLFGERSDVFDKLNEEARLYAESLGHEYVWAPQVPYQRSEAVDALKHADVGIIDIEPYDQEVFKDIADRTKLLVRFGVGYDKVDLKAASEFGIAVSRTTGANTLGVAEMAVSLILSARRMLRINQKCVESGKWTKNVAREMINGTLGIVGFGAIGQAVAQLFKGFNCRVVAYDPFPNREIMKDLGVELVELDELFSTADAITLHVPYSKENHHLVGSRLLGMMKPTAVVVNTSRGNIIDEQALFEALSSKKIAGAGLDVFGQEPLPVESPLLGLDNIVLTPHVSSQTYESLWRIYKMAIDISHAFLSGEDIPHLLNPDYRKA